MIRYQSGLDLNGQGSLASNSVVNSRDFIGTAVGVNATVAVTPVSFVLNGLSIANGGSFGFSFKTTDDVNSDNGVAIDNFVVNATAVPEPATLVIVGLGGIGCFVRRRRRRALLS